MEEEFRSVTLAQETILHCKKKCCYTFGSIVMNNIYIDIFKISSKAPYKSNIKISFHQIPQYKFCEMILGMTIDTFTNIKRCSV